MFSVSKYYFCYRSKALLFGLLLLLNMIIRFPSISHERGIDSFSIHLLANSLSIFGEARWWLDPWSIFGLYPYSYASATAFSLSGLSQLLGIDMEYSILIYCVLLGFLSIFTMYLFASLISEDFLFKYLSALFFSISQGILVYTTWEVSGRGIFMVSLPLFAYLVFKMEYKFLTYFTLTIIMFISLFSSHHYAYFTIPFLLVYIVLSIFRRVDFHIKPLLTSSIYSTLLIISIAIPFSLGLFIEYGSRYSWLIVSFVTLTRWIGPLIPFCIAGIVYSIFSVEKRKINWYFLLSFLFFVPMFFSQTYGKFLLVMFVIIFISYSFVNIFYVATVREKKSKILAYLVILIIISCSFSSFYNHSRTSDTSSSWYMSDQTYSCGMWTRDYIPDNSNFLGTGLEAIRISATSFGHVIVPSLRASDLAYGLVNESDIIVTKTSATSSEFYFEGVYSSDLNSMLGQMNWILSQNDINFPKVQNLLNELNIRYVLNSNTKYAKLINSVKSNKHLIYDNEANQIYVV
ncbi:hypothetical protein HNV12_07880 [Methanococcoides sp. SA1]|nr:hypothetical protein [Methanococcoides sp. SA1]